MELSITPRGRFTQLSLREFSSIRLTSVSPSGIFHVGRLYVLLCQTITYFCLFVRLLLLLSFVYLELRSCLFTLFPLTPRRVSEKRSDLLSLGILTYPLL